jgi:3-phenylpropionate/trans-cinnamate dioxygenase ferredoxin subunit
MAEKQYEWHKVAESVAELRFPENQLTEVEVAGKTYGLGLYKEKLFAFAAKCPHAGARMAQGYIDVLGNVVCPLHRYKFCMENGRNVSGEGYYLKHWPVEVREDGVYMGLEKSGLFDLF